jgi:hypothetical protein
MECEPRWGDSLSPEVLPEWRDHPTPLALRAIDPPPRGEGKSPPENDARTSTHGSPAREPHLLD